MARLTGRPEWFAHARLRFQPSSHSSAPPENAELHDRRADSGDDRGSRPRTESAIRGDGQDAASTLRESPGRVT